MEGGNTQDVAASMNLMKLVQSVLENTATQNFDGLYIVVTLYPKDYCSFMGEGCITAKSTVLA